MCLSMTTGCAMAKHPPALRSTASLSTAHLHCRSINARRQLRRPSPQRPVGTAPGRTVIPSLGSAPPWRGLSSLNVKPLAEPVLFLHEPRPHLHDLVNVLVG